VGNVGLIHEVVSGPSAAPTDTCISLSGPTTQEDWTVDSHLGYRIGKGSLGVLTGGASQLVSYKRVKW
jgi:hypothetical protein